VGEVDRPVRRLFWLFALLFVALIGQLTYVQVWAAPSLKVHPANTRAIEDEMRVERGVILSADGEQLAANRKQGPYFLRSYPQGDLTSPWLGYNSLRYGRAGVERVYNEELSGQGGLLDVVGLWDRITGQPRRGADLKLTVDMRLQRTAVQALGARKGAVVALDPRTGAVLALVSYPRYDPNRLEELWPELNQDPGTPLLNRGTQGLYPPGSVFKIITAAAALETGVVRPDSAFEDTGSERFGGYEVHNYGDKVYGEHDFTRAFASSINTTFAKVGVQTGADTLVRYAEAFGFGKDVPWRLGGAVSRFPSASVLETAGLAQVSFGQAGVLSSPLLMALAAAAVANGGRIMEPYLVQEVRDYYGNLVMQAKPEVWLTPITPRTAATLAQLMVEVVKRGTGTGAALAGVQVAGKTGTAEVAGAAPHAWFAGFAPASDPQVVVAVVVENGGSGGSVAAPIARQVLAAALRR